MNLSAPKQYVSTPHLTCDTNLFSPCGWNNNNNKYNKIQKTWFSSGVFCETLCHKREDCVLLMRMFRAVDAGVDSSYRWILVSRVYRSAFLNVFKYAGKIIHFLIIYKHCFYASGLENKPQQIASTTKCNSQPKFLCTCCYTGVFYLGCWCWVRI